MTRSQPPVLLPESLLIGPDDVDLAEAALVALADRLKAAAEHILPDPKVAGGDVATQVADLLEAIVRSVSLDPDDARIWLLLTASAAAYPTRSDVDRTRRKMQVLEERAAVLALMDDTLALATEAGEVLSTIDVLCGSVIVDVDHSAKFDLHTGIQRVSRSLMPWWTIQHEVVPAAWTARSGALRRLDPSEMARVVEWTGVKQEPNPVFEHPTDDSATSRLIVPWRSVVVMIEVPPSMACDRLAAIGDKSGNRLVGVAHDAIPVVSADMVPSEDTSKFVRYLTAVKFASRMAGVSASAAAEIAGFAATMPTQGLTGPTVVEVPLAAPRYEPVVPPVSATETTGRHGDGLPTPPPTVLVVGSHEPRKNHLAVLHSAEMLWREGLSFALRFIGGSGWGDEFPRRADELRRAGRPIRIDRAVSDSELEDAYRTARFTVFPSLHEGFGLPVAESLAHGTPVITSDFGPTVESASGGGALLVDPRDDRSLTDGMRILVTDDQVLARLRAEIAARPERTWQNYADDLWQKLVVPELRSVQGSTG